MFIFFFPLRQTFQVVLLTSNVVTKPIVPQILISSNITIIIIIINSSTYICIIITLFAVVLVVFVLVVFFLIGTVINRGIKNLGGGIDFLRRENVGFCGRFISDRW